MKTGILKKLTILLHHHHQAEYHASQIDQFIKEEGNDEYASVKLVHHKKNAVKESEARNMAMYSSQFID